MPPVVAIRAYQHPQDYPAVKQLWENSGPGVHLGRSDAPDEIIKEQARDPDLFLVAEADGSLIGSVIGGFDGRRGMIYHLAVQAEFRRLGVGRALMEEVEQRLKACGCLRAYLMVVEGNETAERFYDGLGWAPMNGIITYAKDLE